jgi:hypothetical protein
MAYHRALICLKTETSPAELLPPLLQRFGLEVERPGKRTLMAFERPCMGRPTSEYIRLWADWNDQGPSSELWLETLSGECMARGRSRCSTLLEQLQQALAE